MLNTLFLMSAITATQTHTPSATVVGDIVTIDADIAMLPSSSAGTDAGELLTGTMLAGDAGLAASSDGASPITWRLAPGEYQITAYGFPDDRLNPLRNVATLTVTIGTPTRTQQIADALQRLTLALFDAGRARATLDTLNPTRQELIDALTQEP